MNLTSPKAPIALLPVGMLFAGSVAPRLRTNRFFVPRDTGPLLAQPARAGPSLSSEVSHETWSGEVQGRLVRALTYALGAAVTTLSWASSK